MSYLSEKTVIITWLTEKGYQEVPKVLDISEADSKHKSIVLKPRAVVTEGVTSTATLGTYLFELQVRYKNVNTIERDENFQLYKDLINYFHKNGLGVDTQDFVDDPDREYFSLANITFEWGVHGCG